MDEATVRIGGRAVLGPVDLRIRTGEHWVFLGPNGSGKTTLLRLAGALRQPSAGRVAVLGATIGRTDLRALRPRIGHISHAIADQLRPTITALQVVLTGRDASLETWFREYSGAERSEAAALLTRVGCGELAGRGFATCSMGERQRILLARALFGRHELLLFDEPAAGLDIPARELLLGAMTEAAGAPGGPVTVLATHHLEEIPSSATHAGLLRGGRLVASGPVEEVLRPEPLEACLGIAVQVERRGGRWWGWAQPA